MPQAKTNRGFTLIELLLYVGLMAILLFANSLFLSFVLEARIKNQVVAEVEQQGAFVTHLVGQIIRNAQSINSPAQGNSGAALSLEVAAPNNPTVFSLAAGQIQITGGAAPAVPLTNGRVTASGLNFYNLSRTGTPGVVRIQFTLSHLNPGGRYEYNYSQMFYGNAALRYP